MYLVIVKVIIRFFDIVGYKDVISMILLTFDLIWKSRFGLLCPILFFGSSLGNSVHFEPWITPLKVLLRNKSCNIPYKFLQVLTRTD